MSWIRHNRQLFDWQIMPTYVPAVYPLETTSLYGHLKGIDLLLQTLQALNEELAEVARSGQYADLVGAPDPQDYYTASELDSRLSELMNASGPQSLSGPVVFGNTISPPIMFRHNDPALAGVYTSHELENGRPLYKKHLLPQRRIRFSPNDKWECGVQLTEDLWIHIVTGQGDEPFPWLAIWPGNASAKPLPTLDSLYQALFRDTLLIERPERFLAVDGAGVESVNGFYQHDGELASGKPVYRNIQDQDLVLKWMQLNVNPPSHGWAVYDGNTDTIYYYNQQSHDPAVQAVRPDLVSGEWHAFDAQNLPAPTITPHQTRIDAEGPVALRYRFPAGDSLHSDGSNLFYTSADGLHTNQLTSNGGG